jgi:hypothetical protein
MFMGGLVVNCKKCNKIFQQRLHPICPECIRLADEQFTLLYRRLQHSAAEGGIAIDDLAKELSISQEEIEKYYLEGRFSLAGMYLQIPCQACGVLCSERERKGRFCLSCSEETANQAGVEVKTFQELKQEEEEATRQRLRHEAQFKKRSASGMENRFGSLFRH